MKTQFTLLLLIIINSSCEFFNSTENSEVNEGIENTNNKPNIDSLSKTPEPIIYIDTFHNELGNLLAGIDNSFINENILIDSNFWSEYRNEINNSFSKIKKNRLDLMTKWSSEEVSNKINDTCLLFYPFSGADFLHAYYLYPNANEYLLLAEEKIGEIPDLKSMNDTNIQNYLYNVNYGLRDIYKRSYFITKNMRTDTKKGSVIKGLLPLFYWFIARSEHEIINISKIAIDTNGKLITINNQKSLNKNLINGIQFQIRKKGESLIKKLKYFHCDISNEGFEENPEFKKYLNSIRPANTFVKSASYLMNYGSFSEIRELVLDKSNSLLEDDTGIPYEFFDHTIWNINLYGEYVMPVKDFNETRYQNDLNLAYKDSTLYKGKIPFSLGYHWGSKKQNQMLYTKK